MRGKAMVKTIFMGHTCEWSNREEAERFFKSLLLYGNDVSAEALDRVNTVIDNLRTGKDPAVDFESVE